MRLWISLGFLLVLWGCSGGGDFEPQPLPPPEPEPEPVIEITWSHPGGVAGFELVYREPGDNYWTHVFIEEPSARSYELPLETGGVWSFKLAAFDYERRSSNYSGTLEVLIEK